MNGQVLDVVLVVAVLLFAYSGYRQGLVAGVFSFIGFFGGGLLGAQLAEPIAEAVDAGLSTPAVAIIVVFVFASVGQLVAAVIGSSLRRRITYRPVRAVDSAGGAVLSVVSLLLVAWLVGTAVASAPYPRLAASVRNSTILAAVDSLVPADAGRVSGSFRRLVNESGFPQVFGGLRPTNAAPVAAPDPRLANSRAVQVARDDVLKVTGTAKACSRRVEGTGFVYAPERVMTNAHVVAGVTAPEVEVGQRKLAATVVLFDPGRDVAVLRVPGLRNSPLAFAGAARAGGDALVAGYPGDGPLTVIPARIRGSQQARGPDIYSGGSVTREVYALRARVRPGNSGGPLLAPDGRVYGVVFAAAADDPDTGYALTAREVASSAKTGATATRAVSTRGCS